MIRAISLALIALAFTACSASACWYPGKNIFARGKSCGNGKVTYSAPSCASSGYSVVPTQVVPSSGVPFTNGVTIQAGGNCPNGKCYIPQSSSSPSIMPHVYGERR